VGCGKVRSAPTPVRGRRQTDRASAEPRDLQFVPDPEYRKSLAEATHELQLELDPDFL